MLDYNIVSDNVSLYNTALFILSFFFFFNDPAPPDIYPLPLHAPLPLSRHREIDGARIPAPPRDRLRCRRVPDETRVHGVWPRGYVGQQIATIGPRHRGAPPDRDRDARQWLLCGGGGGNPPHPAPGPLRAACLHPPHPQDRPQTPPRPSPAPPP